MQRGTKAERKKAKKAVLKSAQSLTAIPYTHTVSVCVCDFIVDAEIRPEELITMDDLKQVYLTGLKTYNSKNSSNFTIDQFILRPDPESSPCIGKKTWNQFDQEQGFIALIPLEKLFDDSGICSAPSAPRQDSEKRALEESNSWQQRFENRLQQTEDCVVQIRSEAEEVQQCLARTENRLRQTEDRLQENAEEIKLIRNQVGSLMKGLAQLQHMHRLELVYEARQKLESCLSPPSLSPEALRLLQRGVPKANSIAPDVKMREDRQQIAPAVSAAQDNDQDVWAELFAFVYSDLDSLVAFDGDL
jgi:hypothetical protein